MPYFVKVIEFGGSKTTCQHTWFYNGAINVIYYSKQFTEEDGKKDCGHFHFNELENTWNNILYMFLKKSLQINRFYHTRKVKKMNYDDNLFCFKHALFLKEENYTELNTKSRWSKSLLHDR